jgi:hypothetical protein
MKFFLFLHSTLYIFTSLVYILWNVLILEFGEHFVANDIVLGDVQLCNVMHHCLLTEICGIVYVEIFIC